MKAIRVSRFGEPDVLVLEDCADPVPGPGQVLVRLSAIGVNPVDTYIRSGTYGERPLPYTPGTDGAGVVEAVGSEVSHPVPGDRVYAAGSVTGTYAELALCQASQVHPLPDNVGFEQGAALNVPYCTAYRALFQRGGARPGERLLVHGASGGVGVAALQWARAAGLQVVGTAGTPEGLRLVAEQGAHHVLDHHAADLLESVMAWSGGQGVDLILEMLANRNLDRDLDLLARGGRVVVIGSRGRVEIDPRKTMTRDADVRGMSLWNASDADLRSIRAALGAGLESGVLRPLVGRRLPLAEASRAHRLVLEPGALGKIVLIP
ncbi:MAG: NADPH:quinone reductase [Armatimonadetes bacterium]|nr:NADPH:quinone reductase [Armatimonadota bacterium]